MSGTPEYMATDAFAVNIAIGVHTGLRKGTDAPSSARLWQAINECDDTAWADAARFAAEGIESMGYKLVKVEED
jgi:hypothetical protein